MLTRTTRPNGISRGAIGLPSEARALWAAAGAILGTVAASSCCIVPLVLLSVGISGAWIGNLTALEPYKPIFIAITLGFLGYGYWIVYRKPPPCGDNATCAKPLPVQVVKSSLWISTSLVLLAMFWNWIAPAIAPIMLGL